MASAGPQPQKGRGKSLDAEINLVPFIDLLSMCICFLLMTAVWVEVGAVNVKQAVGTEAPDSSKPSYEMDLKMTGPTSMQLSIRRPDKGVENANLTAASVDTLLVELRQRLAGFSQRFSNEADVKAAIGQAVSVARVTTKAGVSYGDLVSIMDTLRDSGVVNIGVTPVKE